MLHLTLALRRFRCRESRCPRHTFVERIPRIAPPYARSTMRIREGRQSVGLALGGEAGARLAARLGLGTSPDTLLRLIRAAPLPPAPPPRIIGIDDWAQRRGQRSGTIVLDLETRRPVDLLPDRSAAVVAAWLRTQPTVECISRDRADDYIVGATQGAPNARQVADRWHLIKNLGDALQRDARQEWYGVCLRRQLIPFVQHLRTQHHYERVCQQDQRDMMVPGVPASVVPLSLHPPTAAASPR